VTGGFSKILCVLFCREPWGKYFPKEKHHPTRYHGFGINLLYFIPKVEDLVEGATVQHERAERCNYQLNFSILVEDRPVKNSTLG